MSNFYPYFGGQLQSNLMGTVQPQQQPQYQPPAIAQPSSGSSSSQQSGPLGCSGVFSCIIYTGAAAPQPQTAAPLGQAGPLGCSGVFSCIVYTGAAGASQPQALGSPQELTAQVRQEAQAMNLGASGALGTFCQYWPNAKMALQLLLGVVSNPIVKTGVTLAISVGDGLC